jgi:peptide/nickel transport system ATP-binding protein
MGIFLLKISEIILSMINGSFYVSKTFGSAPILKWATFFISVISSPMNNRSTEIILDVKNLTTVFQNRGTEFKAVNGISFEIKAGETIGIVGESGSGKSVTSLSLMKLIVEPPGKIVAGNAILRTKENSVVDLLKLNQSEIRKYRGNEIAMIFQEPMTSLNPVFTCGSQVAEVICLHQKISKKEARSKTIALFEKVKLPRPDHIFDSYPHQISGGQKQRVMIAMAISCNPRILIADEPTTALDVTVQATILDLLKELQSETGMGMIFITHDLGVISKIADNVLVMYKGNVVEQGTSNEIFTNPKHPYTKGLLACRPSNNMNVSRLPVISDFMKLDKDGSFIETGLSIQQLVEDLRIDRNEETISRENIYLNEPILKVQNLKVEFPVKKNIFGKALQLVSAVNNVSFEVYPGETLGLVGESGCGKTTLGRCVLNLISPTSGSVKFKNIDISLLEANEMRRLRKQMQLIFQDPYSSLNPRMTIGSAILEPMQVHRLYSNDVERKEMVRVLLKQVNLSEDFYNRYPHQFSGGQRQRICIARALAVNPEFLICDESVSALDVSVQAQVLNLLNELKAEKGLTYIFISHDLSVVKYMSDRMMVMNKGVIEEMGNADDIYRNPKSAYTKKLIAAIPN